MKFLGVLAFLLVLSSVSAAAPFSGKTVTRIDIQDSEGRPWPAPGYITQLLTVEPGDVLSGADIRQGISYLYLTGKFRDVRVEGFADGDGVRLVYTLVPVIIVEAIEVTGNHALSKSKIMEALERIEGSELREDRFPEFRTALLALYQAEGYYGGEVDFKVEPLKKPYRSVLHISVREPRPTVIEDVHFSGNTVFTKKQLLRVMKNKPGDPLRTNILFDHDLAAILEAYTKAGYPAAKPGLVNISFRDKKANVFIEGNEGPRVFVSFSGNKAFSDSQLRKQLLIWSEHDVTDAILDSSVDKIRDLYRGEGYDNIKAAVKTAEGPGRLDLTFEIREGSRITLGEVRISGNSYFSTKQIRREMTLRESGWFSSPPFTREQIRKDVEYLRDRYLDQGFLSAEVTKKIELTDNGREAAVTIEISEGPQTMAGSATFEGNSVFTENELLARLRLKPGDPYNDRTVDEDRYRLLSAYSEKGYLYARVDVERKPGGGVVDVTYKIFEHQPVRIGKIILRGNERTRQGVIMRELLVGTGDTYSYEKILKSQQRIYRRGYFDRARFEPVHPGEKEYVKDMLLSLEERPAGSVEVGFGYGELDRARAFLEVSHRNLWGLAQYGGIRFEKSDILERAILNYQHPWFFGHDLNGKFSLTWSDFTHINSDTREVYYETRETAASYGLEKKLDLMKASLTYAFENVENYNVEPGAILSKEDEGHVRVSSLSPAVVWDLRDDIFNPRRGALYGIVLKKAMHQLGSEADFTKAAIQSSWYFPFGAAIVTAVSARAGMAWPHYQTTELPLHERFVLGGNTTIRGYTQDLVGPTVPGPDGKPVPAGGSSMAQFNAEIRFTLNSRFGFVLFGDAGNVWADQNIRLGDLRASSGAGIRYGTPIGPLRIDYGQKINRRPGESPGELHFNIGHTF